VSAPKSIILRLRRLIQSHYEALRMFDGRVEINESYFGVRRKGNRCGVALGKK